MLVFKNGATFFNSEHKGIKCYTSFLQRFLCFLLLNFYLTHYEI